MKRTERDLEFQGFYRSEAQQLNRLAWLLTHNQAAAADLAQETLTRMYVVWEKVRRGEPRAYAHTVLINLFRSQHRRTRREREHAWSTRDDAAVEGHEDSIAQGELLKTALLPLSPVRRAVLVLRFFEGLSIQEIADRLDRPVGTVKSDLRRGLGQLKKQLEEQGVTM